MAPDFRLFIFRRLWAGYKGRGSWQMHLAALLLFAGLAFPSGPVHVGIGSTQHIIYFENTDYELHVYRIQGEQPGKTLMIIGGIHNEPGGYLAADLYVDVALQKGNLIVVPRANFPSVVSNNRWINGDMNRQFAPDPKKPLNGGTYEDKVVDVLKKLMSESDVLLNLHDGSGFYRPEWISNLKNPTHWGQSIIADDDEFVSPKDGRAIPLKSRALRIMEHVNARITEPEHRFHFNDTRTAYKDSPHPEMRGSATFFALSRLGVESFGVETSQEIEPLDIKVKYQSLVVNAFMDDLGIVLQNPKIALDPPHMEYLLVSVNGQTAYGIPNGATFTVHKGDQIQIEHIAANYERGLIADILGVGGLNDLHKPFTVDHPLKVLVKKDQFPCGEVHIEPTDGPSPVVRAAASSPRENRVIAFLMEVDGAARSVPDGESLTLSTNQVLRIKGVEFRGGSPADVQLNFVGFVPSGKSMNDGEDRGFPITKSILRPKFSAGGKGLEYAVTARYKNREIGRIRVLYDR